MDNRVNRQSASFEVRSIDDATVAVAGHAAVFKQETVVGGLWRRQSETPRSHHDCCISFYNCNARYGADADALERKNYLLTPLNLTV